VVDVRFVSSGSSVSIIWFIRSIPSVVTFRTCVSPALEEPGAVRSGHETDLAESWRISSTLRPSSRTPSSMTRRRIRVFCSCLNAGEISDPRSAKVSSLQRSWRCALSSSFSAERRSSRSCFAWNERLAHPVAGEGLDLAVGLLGVERLRLERLLLDLHAWRGTRAAQSIDSPIARFAASRPSVTISSVAPARLLDQVERRVGRLALDHQDVDRSRVVAAPGDHDVERRVLELLVGRLTTHSPLILPTRTAPTGPSNGRPASIVARLAALMPGTS
jgi:hypothetical protein